MIRSNVVWITVVVDKILCKSTDGSFGRSVACREGKCIFRISVYSFENKMLPLL